ncbi:MAG TPA: hypothetical protein ENK49_00055 [Gammaproteobacteria bacterium]|nr:hypothetical protein [Gammaproteobacteria bacterium]
MSELPARGQFTVTFPMGLLLRHYEGEKVDRLNRDLSRLILKLEAETRAGAKTTAAQGGFHTEPSFVNRKDSVVTRFRERVLIPGVQHYMTGYYRLQGVPPVELTPDRLSIQGWANVMRAGEWNAPHNHITSHFRLSAVYYLQTPDCTPPEGALQLENPNQISVQHGAYGNAKIHPRAGDLVIFPCYQVHFSHPFSVPGERILIASDIRVHDQFDELGVNHYNTMSISSAGAG